jgi:hypothetical protein
LRRWVHLAWSQSPPRQAPPPLRAPLPHQLRHSRQCRPQAVLELRYLLRCHELRRVQTWLQRQHLTARSSEPALPLVTSPAWPTALAANRFPGLVSPRYGALASPGSERSNPAGPRKREEYANSRFSGSSAPQLSYEIPRLVLGHFAGVAEVAMRALFASIINCSNRSTLGSSFFVFTIETAIFTFLQSIHSEQWHKRRKRLHTDQFPPWHVHVHCLKDRP